MKTLGKSALLPWYLIGSFSTSIAQTVEWTWVGGSDTKDQSGVYGTKGTASSSNIPGGRNSGATWTDANDNMWLFGGYGYDKNGKLGDLNDLWKFDGTNWTWVAGQDTVNGTPTYGTKGTASSSNIPGARMGAAAVIDNSGNAWLFGGRGLDNNSDDEYLNDLWKFDGTNWTWVSGDNSGNQDGIYGTSSVYKPGSRWYPVLLCDSSNNLYLFAGLGYDESSSIVGYLNDLWKYDGSAWSFVDGQKRSNRRGFYNTKGVAHTNTGLEPGARAASVGWIDSGDTIWIYGGAGYDVSGTLGYLNDVWKYDGTYWTFMTGYDGANSNGIYGTKGTPSSTNSLRGRQGGKVVQDKNGMVWGYGGGTGSYINDVWKFNGQYLTWIGGDKTLNQNPTYGTKGDATLSNEMGGKYLHHMWITSKMKIWSFGGYGRDKNGNVGRMNDMWVGEPKFLWTGGSTDFNSTSNWNNGAVPNRHTKLSIPASLSNYPSISDNTELGDIEIANGGSLSIASGKMLTIYGNLTYDGSTANNFGSGTIELKGSSAQTISGPITANVTINNSNDVILTSAASIGTLTLTQGDLDIGNNDLTLTGTVSGGSSTSYVKISGSGRVKASVGSNPVIFPVGRNPYLPIIIDDGGGAEFSVGVSDNVYDNPQTQGTAKTAHVVSETWTIQADQAVSNVIAQLGWNAAEEETGFNRSQSMIGYWENSVSTSWNTTSSFTSATGSDPYYQSRTINFTTNLFYLGVGSNGSALPVELTYFEANWSATKSSGQTEENESLTERSRSQLAVELTWETSIEENNSHFSIQRSLSGAEGNWETIGRMEGNGTSEIVHSYLFTDRSLPSTANSDLSTIYYRLKQIDFNGAFEYSPVRTLQTRNPKLETSDFSVYPNPVSGKLSMSTPGNYTVIDITGKSVLEAKSTQVIDVSLLENGIYLIKNNKGAVTQFVKK